jgi:6-phosphogluconate dehydrogenase
VNVGIVGLGRMGAGIARRLARGGHAVHAWNRRAEVATRLAAEEAGVTAHQRHADLVAALSSPRVIWIMVPAGDAVQETIESLAPLLARGDILIDGGNSDYRDSVRRGRELAGRGVEYVDIGTSGGVWGLEEGFCQMVGGTDTAWAAIEPAVASLAPEGGYRRVGPSGAGHFVKMVHNGIEYGLLQAYAEGFEILEKAPYDLDLPEIAEVWRHGSVVRSWLLDLAERALREDPRLERISGWVDDSGYGRGTVLAAMAQDVPAPVLTLSLMMRFRSRQADSFAGKVVAALRQQFGGHAVKKA